MAIPSVKGSVFEVAVQDVRKLLESGTLSREQAGRWLESDDFDQLDEAVVVSGWYDIRSYDRMNQLLLEALGHGNDEFLREAGRQTARNLLDGGFYAQMEYLQRAEVKTKISAVERFEAFGRDLVLLSTLSSSIFNFTTWTSKPDLEHEGRYVIEVSDAADFPETCALRAYGFINEMATEHGEPDLWRWSRPRPDLIVFEMVRQV